MSSTCRPFEKALERVSNATCAKATVTLLVIIAIMVLLMVGRIIHPHHNMDPMSQRSRKLTSSTVPVTLPMDLMMLLESLCLLTILMMLIVLPRMLLLFWICLSPPREPHDSFGEGLALVSRAVSQGDYKCASPLPSTSDLGCLSPQVTKLLFLPKYVV
jgi:hypothetical protein